MDTPRRSMERGIARYKRFAEKVSALTPDAWSRMQERCAELNGDSFAALVRRANLTASVYELPLPPTPIKQQSPAARVLLGAIRGMNRTVQTGLALAFELASEFDSPDHTPETPSRSFPRPETNAYVEASFLLEATVQRKAPDPGVAAAIRAAAQAVMRHDLLISPDAFDDVYRYVADEIPFDSLEPPQQLLTAGQVSE